MANDMRRFIPAVLLTLTASCLELEQSIEIRADGSGHQKMTLGMTARVVEAVERSAPAASPLGGVDPLSVFERDLVDQELRQRGLSLLSHRTWSERRRRFVELEAEFPGLEALQNSPLSGSKAEWVVQPGKGKWKQGLRLIFYPQGRVAWQQARQQAETMQEGDPTAESLFATRREQMSGLDVTLHITVPGEILWTYNMEKVGPRTATARHTDADVKSPGDLIQLLAPRYEVIFDARGCAW